MVFKDNISGQILYKQFVKQETNNLYLLGVEEIARRGIKIQSFICEKLQQLIEQLQPDLEEVNGTIELVNIPEKIQGIPILVRQLFSNLIQNALKFHSKKPLQISVEAQPFKSNCWQFTVRDNVIGILAKLCRKEFQKDKKVRTFWDETNEEWYLSIVDEIAVLTESVDPNAY